MLYVMRHGKTDWNERRKLQGRTDIPLNDNGRKMAEEAGEENKDVHFDICYCSPLIRAKETAELFLKGREVPIVVDERLREMSFGDYEGVEQSFQIPNHPVNGVFVDPAHYKTEGGVESFQSLYARTGEFLKEVVEPRLAKGEDVVIVAHGAVNSCIFCQIKEKPLAEFWSAGIENCKLMKLK